MLQSCGKTYKLSEEALAWQPYKVGDVLIFKSNKGEIDTIYVREINSHTNPSDPLDFFPDYHQSLFVTGEIKLREPKVDMMKKKYFTENINLLNLHADEESPFFYFVFEKKTDTLDYPTTALTLDSLKLEFKTKKKLKYGAILIQAKEHYDLPFDYDLANFWWSKEYGYVRYEFKDGYYWELREFIRDNKNILK